MKIGYARVSTVDQNEARQMEALREEGVDRIYMDKKSGKDFNRPEYQKMISELHKGDVLVIHSIDRLGRNYEEIITEWRKITKEIEADIIKYNVNISSRHISHCPDIYFNVGGSFQTGRVIYGL